ncbi:polysaccharide biosynthesis tyrosine autokinase [uncultured Pelagimonas sp.]|uniref:GumC family protein n=1 Tax=uncultured Pelagimonas sp. TaxID=1618102 RepID=UPI0026356891|nr:polysaccharide biosynthesis tyrosine autokinase [uncultured Pelagimonas sp.]
MQQAPFGSVPHSRADQDTEDEGGINIRVVAATLWRGKWIIAICVLLSLTLAFFRVSQQVPSYRAAAKVIFDLERRNITDIEEVISTGRVSRERLRNELEVLQSTALIERVIDDLELEKNPVFNPSLRPPEPSFRQTYLPWITLPPEVNELASSMGLISPAPPPPDPETIARRQRLNIIVRVRNGLQLVPIRNSTIIEIGFVSSNPQLAAKVANAMADQYIVEQLEGKLEATRSATDWLSTRVQELQDKVETTENEILSVRAQIAKDAGQSLEITRVRLAELNAALSDAQSREFSQSAQYNRLVSALEGRADIGTIPEFRASAIISGFRQDESELMSRIAALGASVGEDHPSMQRLNAQLLDVRRKMLDEAQKLVEAVRVERDAAQTEALALINNVRDLEQKALLQSTAEIQLQQMERQAQASKLLYENFLGRLQETAQQESLTSADARVITPAEVPRSALAQSRKRVLTTGAIMGLILGVGAVILINKLNNTFRSPAQVEEILGLPVLGGLPAAGHKLARKDVIEMFLEKPTSSLAEAVRNFRTSVLLTNIDKPPQTVMVTSSIPSEGKSTTSVLLALTSQQMGRSTILVDCDFRLPSMAKILKIDADKPGILSLMNGTAELDDVMSVEPRSGLHVLMARPQEAAITLNPADVLSSQKFKDLLDDLRSKYDLVILDTPPALVVSDARIVSKVVDTVVYMIKWDSTPHGVVKEGVKELRSIDAPIAGTVLTMIDEEKATKYSYEGYGYHRGRYRDYYLD